MDRRDINDSEASEDDKITSVVRLSTSKTL